MMILITMITGGSVAVTMRGTVAIKCGTTTNLKDMKFHQIIRPLLYLKLILDLAVTTITNTITTSIKLNNSKPRNNKIMQPQEILKQMLLQLLQLTQMLHQTHKLKM